MSGPKRMTKMTSVREEPDDSFTFYVFPYGTYILLEVLFIFWLRVAQRPEDQECYGDSHKGERKRVVPPKHS